MLPPLPRLLAVQRSLMCDIGVCRSDEDNGRSLSRDKHRIMDGCDEARLDKKDR